MSEENVAVVLRGADLFNRGDVDGMMELWHPESVYLDHRPIGWETMDRAEVRELNLSAFAVVRDVQRDTAILADPDDYVVASVRFHGHATDGGGEVELGYAEVTKLLNGLIVRREIYARVEDALASIGP